MDLPPFQIEMMRVGLRGQAPQELCRPNQAGRASLQGSFSGSPPCPPRSDTVRIEDPPGWPPAMPPPLPR